MRMVIVGGMLMLALLVAIIGSVSADGPSWDWAAGKQAPIERAGTQSVDRG
jgi:hypothetical protein